MATMAHQPLTDRAAPGQRPEPALTGAWLAMAAIIMVFAALISALTVRRGAGGDWHHLVLPPVLHVSAGILLLSSLTLGSARRGIAAFARGTKTGRTAPLALLSATLLLGAAFLMVQHTAWQQLMWRGLGVAASPNASFFYVLTAAHGLAVLGGMAALMAVSRRFLRGVPGLHRSSLDAISHYWYFTVALWIGLLLLMWVVL
jgi:cytochrome c oxidase subunit 3